MLIELMFYAALGVALLWPKGILRMAALSVFLLFGMLELFSVCSDSEWHSCNGGTRMRIAIIFILVASAGMITTGIGLWKNWRQGRERAGNDEPDSQEGG